MDIKLEDLLLITSDHIAITNGVFVIADVDARYDVSDVLSKEILGKKIKEIRAVSNGMFKVWLED